jgi:hypothetical protein
LLTILLLGVGSPQPADSGVKQSGGTCTCESRAAGARRIIQCLESASYEECSSYCRNAYSDCDSVHFETGAPSCFDILNGDADWGGQRF